jgi:catechol 2,3-dioxygenase
MSLPAMRLSHMGFAVKNLDAMEAFYTKVLGFSVSDRGIIRNAPMVFLTKDPKDHHQIVLQEQRTTDETTINQISFQLNTLDELRAIWEILREANVAELKPVDHCLSYSVYCHDPEGNRLEFFIDGQFYVHQPMIQELDLTLSDAEIIEATRRRFADDPSFRKLRDWQDAFMRERLASTGNTG